jgi:hypothetical protein
LVLDHRSGIVNRPGIGGVTGTGAERAASARLSIRDTVLVDDVRGGVVLFVTSGADLGITRHHRTARRRRLHPLARRV